MTITSVCDMADDMKWDGNISKNLIEIGFFF